jgi:sugar phosphate isomerase/epimerase
MKIGMLTGLWYVAEGATLIRSLRRAAELGFHFVDFQGVFHAGPSHLSVQERQTVAAEVAALGLEVRNYVLHAPHNLASAGHAELEQCFRYLCEGIDLANAWGVRQLMLNAGQWAYGVDRSTAWSEAVRFIQRVCDYAAPRGVYIVQESEPYVWFLVNDIASTCKMREDVDRPNFATLIDLGHLALERANPDALAPLLDSIIHAHISDHESLSHTNQIVGTGITRVNDYVHWLALMDIDGRLRGCGYNELVLAFELGMLGSQIEDADDWALQSLQHVLQAAPGLTL